MVPQHQQEVFGRVAVLQCLLDYCFEQIMEEYLFEQFSPIFRSESIASPLLKIQLFSLQLFHLSKIQDE